MPNTHLEKENALITKENIIEEKAKLKSEEENEELKKFYIIYI